jgi:hypothetical protein
MSTRGDYLTRTETLWLRVLVPAGSDTDAYKNRFFGGFGVFGASFIIVNFIDSIDNFIYISLVNI